MVEAKKAIGYVIGRTIGKTVKYIDPSGRLLKKVILTLSGGRGKNNRDKLIAYGYPVNRTDPNGNFAYENGEDDEELHNLGILNDSDMFSIHVFQNIWKNATTDDEREVAHKLALSTREAAIAQFSKVRNSQPDSGLSDLSDEEISRRARDKSLSGQERRRYQAEEKYRGLRNIRKREQMNIENESPNTFYIAPGIIYPDFPIPCPVPVF